MRSEAANLNRIMYLILFLLERKNVTFSEDLSDPGVHQTEYGPRGSVNPPEEGCSLLSNVI